MSRPGPAAALLPPHGARNSQCGRMTPMVSSRLA